MMSTRPISLASHSRFSLAFLLVLLMATTCLWANDDATKGPVAETTPASAEASPEAPFGVTVFVDPETGELTDQPTPAQEAWLREERQRRGKSSGADAFEPRPVPLLQGGEGLALHDFVVSSTVVVTQPSGAWTTTCRRDGVPHSHAHPTLVDIEAGTASDNSDTSTSTDAAPVM